MSTENALRVLVVDDDPEITDFLTTCFADAGYEVCAAPCGEDALQKASSFAPDVVFLDILIPEQDGWLVCSKMKLHASSPAIVMMTGRHEAHTRRFASFVHADAFLAKPFAAEDALHLLENFAVTRKAVS